jgi:membrane protein implicated in regulation of membrane protease activity
VSRERAVQLWERWSTEPGARWVAIAAVPSMWLSIAWVDLRFLAFIPLALVVTLAIYRWRPPRRDDPDDFVL